MSAPLEPDTATLRAWFGEALELLYHHLETLPRQPSANVDGAAEEARALPDEVPEEAADGREVLRFLVRDCVPRSFNTAGPGYLAYVPGGGIVHAALADLVSNVVNRYVGVYAAAPLLVRLEMIALSWLRSWMGYPGEARGIFTSGGSMANFSAVLCAREKVLGAGFQDGTVYCSDQVHHSIPKAALLAGFPRERIRVLPSDTRGALAPQVVREAVYADRARGLRPALLVASAGTVNTGVIDPLPLLAEEARSAGLWFHVDAAYGGLFRLTERGKELLRGIEESDSCTVDPHKGLFLPYGTGCLLVRRAEDLRRAHHVGADYLPGMQADPEAQDFCMDSPELSRGFRGLRVWLPVQLAGARAFRECLDEKLDLAQFVAAELRGLQGLEVVGEPQLSLIAFRVAGDDAAGSRTHDLLRRINATGRVMVSGTVFQGRFVVRICILSFRTHRDRLEEFLMLLRGILSARGEAT